MAGISQTIPSYTGGMSEQPDYLKPPGKVSNAVNVIPDLTYGLYKRLGSKRIASLGASAFVEDSTWFHYYRGEVEGTYIGQINKNGAIRMWRTKAVTEGINTYAAGSEVQVKDVNGNAIGSTVTDYLKNQGSDTADTLRNIQVTSITDSTFICNREVIPEMDTATTSDPEHVYYAYLELRKTENGRQYGIDIGGENEVERSYNIVTRIQTSSTGSRPADGAANQGHCPHIGAGVFWTMKDSNAKNDLVFRLVVTGQQGISTDSGIIDDPGDYSCTYQNDLTLLYGGENFVKDDTVTVDLAGVTYTIKVEGTETYKSFVIGTSVMRGGDCGQVRPRPTPFDADTAVSASEILAGIKNEFETQGPFTTSGGTNASTHICAKIIGNGIYFYSDTKKFTVRVLENDLMRVIGDETHDVSSLPNQCKNGYMVKVNNSEQEGDDYWLKFQGNNDSGGPGTWVETTAPGLKKQLKVTKMPLQLIRHSISEFRIKEFDWTLRTVGDNVTNPEPVFANKGQPINKVFFWRNRLALLHDTYVSLSAPDDLGRFWNQSALGTGVNDPIAIRASSKFASQITNAIETSAGLVLFTQNEQFLLTTDDSALTTDTAKIIPLSTYFNNKLVSPISLGTTLAFLDNSGSHTRFMEMQGVQNQAEPVIFEHSKAVPTMIPKDVNIMQVSRDNGMVFIGKKETDTVYLYRYFVIGDQRLLSSWVKWKFPMNYKYFCVTDDSFYYIDKNSNLQRINLIRSDEDLMIPSSAKEWDVHLDHWQSIAAGSYSASTGLTTWTSITNESPTAGTKEVIINAEGVIGEITRDSTTITVPGDWSSTSSNASPGTMYRGFIYDMEVDLPKFYPSKRVGNSTVADVNGSLTLHRLKVALGKVGSYESKLTRVGKADYTDVYESAEANVYEAGDVPYLTEEIRTIPVYENNKNVNLKFKSSHPSPATLRSIAWEGDYNPKNYRRL